MSRCCSIQLTLTCSRTSGANHGNMVTGLSKRNSLVRRTPCLNWSSMQRCPLRRQWPSWPTSRWRSVTLLLGVSKQKSGRGFASQYCKPIVHVLKKWQRHCEQFHVIKREVCELWPAALTSWNIVHYIPQVMGEATSRHLPVYITQAMEIRQCLQAVVEKKCYCHLRHSKWKPSLDDVSTRPWSQHKNIKIYLGLIKLFNFDWKGI